MEVLTDLKSEGYRAVVLFLVQRRDANSLSPADDIDPLYGQALRSAVAGGVEAYAYRTKVSPAGVSIIGSIPVRL